MNGKQAGVDLILQGEDMRVKVNGHIFDTIEEPIAITLSDQEKENIKNMHSNKNIYAAGPDWMSEGKLMEFIMDPRLIVSKE